MALADGKCPLGIEGRVIRLEEQVGHLGEVMTQNRIELRGTIAELKADLTADIADVHTGVVDLRKVLFGLIVAVLVAGGGATLTALLASGSVG